MGKERTIEQINTLIETSTIAFKDFHAQCAEADKFYNLLFGGEVDYVPGFDILVPPTATNIIDSATDHVDTKFLKIETPPRSLTFKEQGRAEGRRKFHLGSLHRKESEYGPIIGPSTKHMGMYGVAITKTMYIPDLWPVRPRLPEINGNKEAIEKFRGQIREWLEVKRIKYPLSTDVINAQNLMWDLAHDQPHFVIEQFQRNALELVEKHPGIIDLLDNAQRLDVQAGRAIEVKWTEIWDDEFYTYLVDGKPLIKNGQELLNVRHGYGFNPYDVMYPNFGFESATGAPEDRMRGLLFPIREALKSEARSYTAHAAMLKALVWQTDVYQYDTNLFPHGIKEYIDSIDYSPGAKNELPLGITIAQLGGMKADPVLLDFMDRMTAMAHKGSVSSLIGGDPQTKFQSGFERSISVALSRNKLKSLVMALERGLERINEKDGMLVQNVIKDAITVWAHTPVERIDQTIEPEDFDNYFVNFVTLTAVAPEEQERQARLGTELHIRGMFSRRYAQLKYINMDNPIEDDIQKGAEEFVDSEPWRTFLMVEAARRMGIGDLLPEGMTAGVGGGPFTPAQNLLQFGKAQGIPPNSGNLEPQRRERTPPRVQTLDDFRRMGGEFFPGRQAAGEPIETPR